MITKNRPGDSNQITRDYLDSLLMEMRHIDSVLPSTKLELYGETFDTPIMSAALSHLNNFIPDGTTEMAKGVLGANAVMWIGMGNEAELESIIDTGVKTIKIIKPNIDNDVIFRKIEHAEKYGAFALGMDLDHSFNKKGQYDNVLGEQMQSKTIDEIKSFVDATKLPFIIKGVLSVTDALKCMDAGVQGIVVSHHHGIMDYAVPPLMILPKIVQAVNKRIPIFVDCGIESGIDAFKALALGADAVSAGRIVMDFLKKDKAQGVTDKINSMTEELAGVLARTGSKDIKSIDPNVIIQRT
jgi:hypothetical protein